MMQAADGRHLNNLPTIGQLHLAWDRTVVGKRSMWPCPVIVIEIICQNPSELLFVYDDDSIEAFSPNGTYQPLGKWILPRRSRGGQLLLDAHPIYPMYEQRAVDRITVPQ